GTKFKIGTTTVTCSATDANGNASPSETFTVTVLFATSATGGPTGTVPATLGLTLGSQPASFGTFTPGLAQDYTAQTTATVISTPGDAALSVSDADTSNPGHLVNGLSVMPQALQAQASSPAAGAGSAFAPIGASPLTLLSWTGPVSNDPATITF